MEKTPGSFDDATDETMPGVFLWVGRVVSSTGFFVLLGAALLVLTVVLLVKEPPDLSVTGLARPASGILGGMWLILFGATRRNEASPVRTLAWACGHLALLAYMVEVFGRILL